jgi:hypothetical protein
MFVQAEQKNYWSDSGNSNSAGIERIKEKVPFFYVFCGGGEGGLTRAKPGNYTKVCTSKIETGRRGSLIKTGQFKLDTI